MNKSSPAPIPIWELELTRAPNDRRLYSLEGIGTIRRDGGIFSNSFIAEATGHSWRFAGRGFMQRIFEATTPDGKVVGTFIAKEIKRGGRLDWRTRGLALRPTNLVREKYALTDDNRDIILFEGRAWGRRPVKVSLLQGDEVEPGLVLFAAFVVNRLAVKASSTAGSMAAATAAAAS